MDTIDFSLIDWTKALSGIIAVFHWLFTPMALGLSGIIAVMETIYVRTGDERWMKTTRFWSRIFAVIWVTALCTGLMVLFSLGIFWSELSWWMADVAGVPLTICGMTVFFLETAFIAVMLWGWKHTGRIFHLCSTYLSCVGALVVTLCFSSLLAWMQEPTGMTFNPETARCELTDLGAVLFSDGALSKFTHITAASSLMSGILVVGIGSCFFWYGRYTEQAKDSIRTGTIVGLAALSVLAWSGYDSMTDHTETSVPHAMTWEDASNDASSYTPSLQEKITNGREAQRVLSTLRYAEKGSLEHEIALRKFYDPQWVKDYFSYFGYGHFYNGDINIMKDNAKMLRMEPSITRKSSSVMKWGGAFIILMLMVSTAVSLKVCEGKKWFPLLSVISIPVVYMVSYAGWVVSYAEYHPWVIKNLLPVFAAVSQVHVSAVQITFATVGAFLFILLGFEIHIIYTLVKKGFN